MKPKEVIIAMKAAEKFLIRARKLKEAHPDRWVDGHPYWGNKESAALKRTSLDLTMALADMRKPN